MVFTLIHIFSFHWYFELIWIMLLWRVGIKKALQTEFAELFLLLKGGYCLSSLSFFDTSFFTSKVTKVEYSSSTNHTEFVHFDIFDRR